MRSRGWWVSILLVTLTVQGQTHQQRKPTDGEDILQRQVHGTTSIEYYTTKGAFLTSLGRAGVPGGTVQVLSCETDSEIRTWLPLSATLHQVLDTIIGADPQYGWRIEGGVANLLPAGGEPALLKTRITEFRVKEETSALNALNKLLALDEVKIGMEALRLKSGIAIIVSPRPRYPKAFSVECENATLREVLNAIARAQGFGVWEYIETHCGARHDVIIRF